MLKRLCHLQNPVGSIEISRLQPELREIEHQLGRIRISLHRLFEHIDRASKIVSGKALLNFGKYDLVIQLFGSHFL